MATSKINQVTNNSSSGYCKMPDGTLIQWGQIAINNIPITNVWGSLYESSIQNSNTKFAISFVGVPTVTAFAHTAPTSWLESLGRDATQLGAFYLVRPTKVESGVTGVVNWLAIGRWK